ncbi:DNA gyrase inhibitor YacG [Azospirillum sp. TSO35-2]|uniref:DNA gyrase inhibitor YacG n=1 Tax=Azospirillum sp. TSO35-2 TaxID=716796 RepID=UPI000D6032D4|nr:DNA gyrase inhibitor YacG [Azospirillum sp. TSO35-2]PWC33991.1 hypothetical protein TSO352_27020 [Azospirillum sp. TSO35-2]
MSRQSPDAAPRVESQCPICGRPTEPATRPFCSKRCADVDLSRWLGGVYRIEGPETPAAGDQSDGQSDGRDEG